MNASPAQVRATAAAISGRGGMDEGRDSIAVQGMVARGFMRQEQSHRFLLRNLLVQALTASDGRN